MHTAIVTPRCMMIQTHRMHMSMLDFAWGRVDPTSKEMHELRVRILAYWVSDIIVYDGVMNMVVQVERNHMIQRRWHSRAPSSHIHSTSG